MSQIVGEVNRCARHVGYGRTTLHFGLTELAVKDSGDEWPLVSINGNETILKQLAEILKYFVESQIQI
jgi:hypothetical protein